MTLSIRQGTMFLMVMLSAITFYSPKAHADLTEDLQILVLQAETLHLQLQDTTLSPDAVCGPLVEVNQAARDLTDNLAVMNENLVAPLQVDGAMLDAMDILSESGLDLANESMRLSLEVQDLSYQVNGITLKDAITSMLQLSDDIGTMADRIGEMSDKILIMGDNIGLMADRILISQELQNENIQLSMGTILQTQTNVLTLVSSMETQSYSMDMDWITVQGGLLAATMKAVVLNPFRMKYQLENVADDVRSFLESVSAIHQDIVAGTADSTVYLNNDTLIHLSNMSNMLTFLSSGVDGYVVAINGLQAVTSERTLYSSLMSMLQLSADIGVMSNRIVEMGDALLAMSDNIGMEADQILLTQQLQNSNVVITRTSILAAQQMAISIIVRRNLD